MAPDLDPLPQHPAEAPRSAVQTRSLGILALGLSVFAGMVFLPCSVALLLASWFALFLRPLMTRLTKKLGGRTKAAALITTLLVLAVLGPILGALIPIAFSAVELSSTLVKSQQWRDAATNIVGDGAPTDLVKLVREHLSSAWGAVGVVLSTSASVLFGLAMFVVSFFAFTMNGEAVVKWLREHSPLSEPTFDRMAGAYAETGRGLIVGVGLTALIQGALATVTYAIVGIPRALPLGLLTTISALIPGVGTILLWGPVTVILGLGGYPGKAAIVGLSGVFVISSVDNFLKPILTNRAKLKLPSVLVFITMLSGLVAFGPAGLLLGPLVVRLAIEALEIVKESRSPSSTTRG